MHELVRSNDIVLISFVEVLLREAGLNAQVVDIHTSVVEGSIGALPRRVLVEEEDLESARRVLRDADLAQWISTAGGI